MNKFVLLLLTATIASGAVTLHLVRELRAERDNSRALQERLGTLEAALEVRTAATPFTPPPEQLPASEAATGQTGVSQADEEPPHAGPAPNVPAQAAITSFGQRGMPSREERMRMMRESAERQRALMRDPEYRDAMLSQHKMMLSSSYPDLAAELQLTPEDADRFMALLADQQLRSMDQDPVIFDGPPDAAVAQEMQRKAQERQQNNEAEVAALLGHEKTRAWKDYQSTMGVRHQIMQMRNSFASRGAPLQPDQVKPLQQALADAQQRMMQDWNQNPPVAALAAATTVSSRPDPAQQIAWQEEHLRRQNEHNQRVRETVASILTPEQLKVFEEDQNAQLKIQQAQLKMRRAQAEAEARGEISPQSGNDVFFAEGVAISSQPISPR